MIVNLITCFYGRADKVERILRFYLDQDYDGESHLLLYNNSPVEQKLDDFRIPKNKHIVLINNHLDLETGKEYTNTGDIFRDALSLTVPASKIVTFFDSDDCFLPNHISAGVKGMERAYDRGLKAYKPYKSYFMYGVDFDKVHNTLEPSIFIDKHYLEKKGFNKTSATYHQSWELALKREDLILMDPDGPSTLIYNWEAGHNTFKISGSGDDGTGNFINHRRFETEHGNGTLTPATTEDVQKYYDLVEQYEKAHI